MPISSYKRQTTSGGTISPARLASPNTSIFGGMTDLSRQMTSIAFKLKASQDKAEFDEYEAALNMQLVESNLKLYETKGKAVLANPNADGTVDEPLANPTVDLFTRYKEHFSAGKDQFVNQGTSTNVRKALSAAWDQKTTAFMAKVGEWQLNQKEVYEANAKQANADSKISVALNSPVDIKTLQELKVGLTETFDGDATLIDQHFAPAALEFVTQAARKNAKLTNTWLKDNEEGLDKVAPGLYSAMQDEVRKEISFQNAQKTADLAAYNKAKKIGEENRQKQAVNLLADTLLGKQNTNIHETARIIADMDLPPEFKKSMISSIQTEVRRPVSSDPTHWAQYGADAMVGALNTDSLMTAVINQQMSVTDASAIVARNEKALSSLDDVAKAELANADSYIKGLLSTETMFGSILPNNDSKNRYRLAVNRMNKLYHETEKGKRSALFKVDENGVMPWVQEIVDWAAIQPVSGMGRIGASIPADPTINMSATEKEAYYDSLIGGAK